MRLLLGVSKQGGDRRSEEFKNQGASSTLKRGSQAAYLRARLRRDYPDILATYGRSELKLAALRI
jgi:hypothetical protein